MIANPNDVGETLVACLLADGEAVVDARLAGLAARQWEQLPPAAAYHRVVGAAFLGLRASPHTPPDVLDALRVGHEALVRRHLLSTSVLDDLGVVLRRAGVDHVFVKGPVLADAVYPRPDLRDYRDLDVFVRRAHFRRTLEAIESSGSVLIERNWELVLHLLKGELNLVTPPGVVVDLHWSLLYSDELRRSFRWDDERVIDRGQSIELGRMSVRAPDPTDQLLHLCLHAGLAGCHRLGWLQDIRLAATRTLIDWPVLWRRADEAGLRLVVSVALDHTNRCFGLELPVPPGATVWRGLGRGLDAIRPPWHWRGGRVSGHVLAAATRADVPGSFRALRMGLGAELSSLVRDPGHPLRPALLRHPSLDRPNEMSEPAGGRRGREAFLQAVGAAEPT